MADALIETTATNPYESIVSDTTNQISDVNADIQRITSAIEKLEQLSPTSPTLSKLRERLAELKEKSDSLTATNDSAKSLLNSYNESLSNANTMEWIYQLKQAELNRAQKEADQSYRQMSEDVKRAWQNYINALWNATASENAIINANAGREWASAQSTAETRARNYLANAQAQAEQYGNMVTNLNAINDARLNSNAWYVQLSQSNADNTLRQQVMNNFEAQQAALNNSGRSGWSSRWTSNIVDPYEQILHWKNNPKPEVTDDTDTKSEAPKTEYTWSPTKYVDWKTTEAMITDPTNPNSLKRISDVWVYGSERYDLAHAWDIYEPKFWNWFWAWETYAQLNREKTNKFLKQNPSWNLSNTSAYLAENPKWEKYVYFTDKNGYQTAAPLKDLL